MTMHRSIGYVSHAILDFAFAILIAIAPRFVGFAGRQATWCYIFAALIVVLALLTQFRLIGFVSHGIVELTLAIVMVVLPWIAGFARGVLSRNFYLFMGVLLIALWALTDFRGVRAAGRASGRGAAAPPAPPSAP
ncbi:MAG TPA: hypothetical protein VJZ76_11730 [Thermoanaerobaculia bacterium]|nr:hypothetical protein [Thermoanaerobaculia bacterium]